MFELCLFFFEGDDRIMPIVDMLTQLTQLYVRRGLRLAAYSCPPAVILG
jgi:hypothetical protein